MKKLFLRTLVSVFIVGVLLLGAVGTMGLQVAEAGVGDYDIKYSAADPLGYIPPIPYPIQFPILPSGNANGEEYIDSAWYTDPNTDTKVSIESLNPRSMALCQIVPFEFKIKVGSGAVATEQPITFVAGWNIDTTNNDPFGYDSTYGVIAAFVDSGDGTYIDATGVGTFGTATVVNKSWEVVDDEIQGTFSVGGLDPGDEVVVEVWLVLQCTIDAKTGGNVASRLISASTSTGGAISTGNQTVPLLQVGDLLTQDVDLNIVKSDGDYIGVPGHPITGYLMHGDTFWYELTVTNSIVDTVANGVVVTDTLDPNLTPLDTGCVYPATTDGEICAHFVPDYSQVCTWTSTGNIITCQLGAVAAGQDQKIYFPVTIGESTLTTSIEEFGTCTYDPAMYDICNLVSVTTISDDIDLTNNSDSEPKNITGIPTAVDLLYFEGTGARNSVILQWATASELDTIGFNLYRRGRLDGTMRPINTLLIQAVSPGAVEGAAYTFKVKGLVPGKYYYFWLEDVDMYGNTTLHGPIYVKAKNKNP